MRYFEDFRPGDRFELGRHHITHEEIVGFASHWDPQPFHVDEAAARDSPFGGLVASGWHTAAIWMRCYVMTLLHDSASMGSPGVEQLRWLVPVRPDDELAARLRVTAVEPSSTRPDRGTVHVVGEVGNQRGETVLSLTARGYFARRPGSDGA
jgi:acyl dehydratase